MCTRIMDTKYLFFIIFLVNITNGKVTVPKIMMNDGKEMPAIALGTWLGSSDKPTNNDIEVAVRWALEAGYGHIDTAWYYSVEDQVGAALNGVPREKVFITTKLWSTFHERDAVVPALRTSMRDLQLDFVDLFLIHFPCGQYANGTYNPVDYLDTWQEMMEAKKLGLTKSIGVSNFNQKMIDRIVEHGFEKPAALQVEINLNLQQPELLSYCKAQDIVVMGYTPFGSLFHSRAAPDSPLPRVDDPKLIDIANGHNKTVPQIVLRYLVELGVVPLPKTVTKSRIEENIDIFDFQLTEADKTTLRTFDTGYRTETDYEWMEYSCYPFEKKTKQNL